MAAATAAATKAAPAAAPPKPADVKSQVGITAGQVWQALESGGPQTVAELKKKLNGSGELVNFALGWLAREDKIELAPEKRTFRVTLR
ncbi:MAG TPA: winged helix-turn-helix domain-containing protein [Terriglobia bacterium]|nr:winged helix-turn-helix domain-containing protein [Terriglobia bacterium]